MRIVKTLLLILLVALLVPYIVAPFYRTGHPVSTLMAWRTVTGAPMSRQWIDLAAMSPYWSHPWILPFCEKLLMNDREILKLLATNPFPDAPPRHVRAQLYRYRYTSWRELRATGAWWQRSFQREYVAPVTLRAQNRVT